MIRFCRLSFFGIHVLQRFGAAVILQRRGSVVYAAAQNAADHLGLGGKANLYDKTVARAADMVPFALVLVLLEI